MIISGEPFTYKSKLDAPRIRVIMLIRCRLEENVNCRTMPISKGVCNWTSSSITYVYHKTFPSMSIHRTILPMVTLYYVTHTALYNGTALITSHLLLLCTTSKHCNEYKNRDFQLLLSSVDSKCKYKYRINSLMNYIFGHPTMNKVHKECSMNSMTAFFVNYDQGLIAENLVL